jgi:hypothetical protein
VAVQFEFYLIVNDVFRYVGWELELLELVRVHLVRDLGHLCLLDVVLYKRTFLLATVLTFPRIIYFDCVRWQW